MAFTVFDWRAEEASTVGNPLALLETMRRYADRISLFCQAGGISVPRKAYLLYGYLEGSVFEVTARNPGGSFLPKVCRQMQCAAVARTPNTNADDHTD